MEEIRAINYAERKPVWSGLGTDISGFCSVDEALRVSSLNFTVRQRQENIQTDERCPISLGGFKANIKDDGTPLGIVTTKYKVVQNADAFSSFVVLIFWRLGILVEISIILRAAETDKHPNMVIFLI